MPLPQPPYALGTASKFGRRSLSNTKVFTEAYVTLFYQSFCSRAFFRAPDLQFGQTDRSRLARQSTTLISRNRWDQRRRSKRTPRFEHHQIDP